MKTGHPALDSLGEWIDKPHEKLRKYSDGTVFILRTKYGTTHVCSLIGNLKTDHSWKAQRYTDGKIFRLTKRNAELAFILLKVVNDKIEVPNLAAEHAKALAVINAIEERYIDGCDVHEDWKFMGQTAREYLVPSKINEGKR